MITAAAADASTATALPLAGLRVVEFTHMVMGPTCGMILADLGAEVIKVEPPGGEKTRDLPGLGIGFFRSFNRNKKSVVIDLKSEAGIAQALDLIATCDVLVENFRPGLMEELGLGHAALRERFPRLVYASHKGFLPGPYDHRTALDEVVQMMGGLAYMTGPPGRPLRVGTSVNDIMGGMFGVIGILAALRERDRDGGTGRGQEVQSALFENCVFLGAQNIQQYLMTGQPPPPMPARISSWSVYDIFELAGGAQLFIGAVSDRQFAILVKMLGLAHLLDDPAYATNGLRVAARHRLLPILCEALKTRALDELVPELEALGLPYAPIRRPDQLVTDEHLLQSGGLVKMPMSDGGETDVVLLPLLLDGRRPGVRMPLPAAGEHDAEYLTPPNGRGDGPGAA